MSIQNTYLEVKIDNWNDIFSIDHHFLAPFYFRGQNNINWTLQTSIERIQEKHYPYYKQYDTNEKWMIHEFRRKFHLYSQTITPNFEDNFEWLAIMQHYGAPTRLLDFTESIFISAYFAVEEHNDYATIWAVNWHKLRDNLHSKFKLSYKKGAVLKDIVDNEHRILANKFIAKEYNSIKNPASSIIPLEPKFCNDRLAKQQGLFLMPTNSELSFMENLEKAFNRNNSDFQKIDIHQLQEISKFKEENRRSLRNRETLKHPNIEIDVIKFVVDNRLKYIEKSLKRMNITAETLFPGLEGLAKSLVLTKIINF